MALALPGISLNTVRAGIFYDDQGNPLGGRMIANPAFDVIVHLATGSPVVGRPSKHEFDESGMAVAQLLSSNTNGFDISAKGGFDWVISIELDPVPGGGKLPKIMPKRVYLDKNVPSLDLDLLAQVVQPTHATLFMPAVSSVAGLSGVITLAALKTALGITAGPSAPPDTTPPPSGGAGYPSTYQATY